MIIGETLVSPALERVDGAVRLACAGRGPHSFLKDLYQRAPCRVLFPDGDLAAPLAPVLLTTSGGLTDGDRLQVSVTAEAGSQICVTTQAAEKIYRARAGESRVDVRLYAEDGAWLEWLMQETILFDGARLHRRTEAEVATGARLLAVESLVFGRAAMGESFARGAVTDVWRIKRGGQLVWVDALRLNGDVATERNKPFGLSAAAGYATIIYVGADADAHLPTARSVIADIDAHGGATCIDDCLILRLLADDAAALRASVMYTIAALRAAIAGLPAQMPRVWSC